MEGKTVAASAISNHRIEISQEDFNAEGMLFEGRVLQIVNSLALEVAQQHAERSCAAQGIHSLHFKKKAVYGDILICKASVNRSWDSVLEVGIKVVAEDFRTLEQKDILSAYFIFNAVDEEYQFAQIAPVIPETPQQIQRFHDAELRRQYHRLVSSSV